MKKLFTRTQKLKLSAFPSSSKDFLRFVGYLFVERSSIVILVSGNLINDPREIKIAALQEQLTYNNRCFIVLCLSFTKLFIKSLNFTPHYIVL